MSAGSCPDAKRGKQVPLKTGMGNDETVLEGWLVELDPEKARKARLTVAANSTGLEDCRILLNMLGLAEDQERFPSQGAPYPNGHRSPADGPRATLPASGYGGGGTDPRTPSGPQSARGRLS